MVEDKEAPTNTAPASFARRLLAILAADAVGYSRLTEIDEEGTHARLRSIRVGIIDPCVVSYRGQIVKNTGDGFLASFDSPLDAVRCAIELQKEIGAAEQSQPPDRRIQFRMGLNAGQIIVDSNDVFGFDVNVAARLQHHAQPGGIVLSAEALHLVRPRLDMPCEELGALRLKNITRPIRAYSIPIPGISSLSADEAARLQGKAAIPSIAVLPFRTRGNSPDEDYFGSGIVADIIVALQSVRGLMVISRTSTLLYRQPRIDTDKVSQNLGVRYVLGGSVRRAGDRLRITAELIDVEAEAVIWADRYNGDVSELFEFQDQIATRIVWSIAPRVREAELKHLTRKRPGNMNAYDLVMQAIDLMYRMNLPDFTRAGELLQDAVRADETYATAYAYAALWHIHNVAQGWASDEGMDAGDAARLAAAAVDRDSADGFALAILGHTRSSLFREHDTAKSMFDRALDACPSNAMAWTLSSGAYAYTGDGKAAIARAEQGLRLSPTDAQSSFYLIFLGQAHYVNKTYDEGLIWAHKSINLTSHFCAGLRILAATHAALGQFSEAQSVGRVLLKTQPQFRLSTYSERCPFESKLRTVFIDHLRQAGLPD